MRMAVLMVMHTTLRHGPVCGARAQGLAAFFAHGGVLATKHARACIATEQPAVNGTAIALA